MDKKGAQSIKELEKKVAGLKIRLSAVESYLMASPRFSDYVPSDLKIAAEDMFSKAKQLVLKQERVSAAFLQRKLKIGYAQASKILDELERQKIITSSDGVGPRKVLGDS